jgi:hypothetical protein
MYIHEHYAAVSQATPCYNKQLFLVIGKLFTQQE